MSTDQGTTTAAAAAAGGAMDVDVEASKKGTMDIDSGAGSSNGKKAPRFQVKKVGESAPLSFPLHLCLLLSSL